MPSGSVTIDTSLNTSQVVKAGAGLEKTLNRIANSYRRAFAGKEIQSLQQQLAATREAMQPIAQELADIESKAGAGEAAAKGMAKAEAQAKKLQAEYDVLVTKITALERDNHEKFAAPPGTDPQMAANLQTAETDALAGDKNYQIMIAEAETLRGKQQQLNSTLAQMAQAAQAAGGTGSEQYNELNSRMGALREQAGELQGRLQDLGGAGSDAGEVIGMFGSKAAQSFSTARSGLARLLTGLGALAKKGVSGIVSRLKGLTSGISSAGKNASEFSRRLKGIVSGALVFNLISAALRNFTTQIGTAITSSGQMRSALANLQGAFSAAAAPVIQLLTPALAGLVTMAATVCSYVARLVALLTGKSVSGMKTAAKTMSGVGSAVGNAAKQVDKAARSLAGFDEIERLEATQNEGGGGGGGAGGVDAVVPNYDFEGVSPLLDKVLAAIEAGDWYQVGTLLGEKINEALVAVPWEKIDTTVTQWANNLAQTINGLIHSIDWSLLGASFANGVNVILHALDSLAQNVDWLALGKGVADGLNGAVYVLDWAALGRTLTNGFKIAVQMLFGVVYVLDWAALGASIAAMIGASFDNIDWAMVGQALSGLAIGLLTTLSTALRETDWAQIGRDILALLQGVDWFGVVQALAGTLAEAVGALLDFLQLEKFSDWVRENAEPIKNIAIVIAAFMAAWKIVDLGGTIVGIVTALAAFVTSGGLAAAVTGVMGSAITLLTSPVTLVTAAIGALIAIIALLVTHWQEVKAVAADVWDGIKRVWGIICDWFSATVVEPLKILFDGLKEEVGAAFAAMVDKAKEVWGRVTGWFSATIIQPLVALWDGFAQKIDEIWVGITNGIKGAVNGIIGFINGLLSGICGGLNGAIGALNKLNFDVPDWIPGIGGKSFGFSIGTISAPQIPMLAQGAVLPANKPFLAMLGDQRSGTNIEAPLATIEQAVANVMGEVQAGQMAGFEAVVGVLRELLQAVYGIELGDEAVARAYDRWRDKQTVMTGGY